MKKIIFFFFFLVFIIIIINVILRAISPKKTPIETTSIPTPTPVKEINISGVKVNNFLDTPVRSDRQGDTVFMQKNIYQMTYLPKYNSFIISIVAIPFEENRATAGEDFINKLGISKDQACSLNVSIGIGCKLDLEHCGKSYPLSFCQK